jgi:hypothetical protein
LFHCQFEPSDDLFQWKITNLVKIVYLTEIKGMHRSKVKYIILNPHKTYYYKSINHQFRNHKSIDPISSWTTIYVLNTP